MNYLEQQKKVRTPYPRIDFEKVHTYLLKVRDAYPSDDSLTRDQIVQALGLSPKSGTAHMALGALSHYGLAYKTGSQQDLRYNLTDLALKLIKSQGGPSWKSLALKSTTLPETFGFLYSLYKDKKIPDDIDKRLIKRYPEVYRGNVSGILKLFYDSMGFINRDVPVEIAPKIAGDQKKYEFPIGNGVVISVDEEVVIKALKYYLKSFSLD